MFCRCSCQLHQQYSINSQQKQKIQCQHLFYVFYLILSFPITHFCPTALQHDLTPGYQSLSGSPTVRAVRRQSDGFKKNGTSRRRPPTWKALVREPQSCLRGGSDVNGYLLPFIYLLT
jgi:hypothetical protein